MDETLSLMEKELWGRAVGGAGGDVAFSSDSGNARHFVSKIG